MSHSARGRPTALRHTEPGVLTVFVSSPFQGMEAEREVLAKRVFPQLRETLGRRGIVLQDIDLRWGVTEEAAQDQQTLSVCFREMARSDVVIGLLAGRYGWIPESFSEELLSEHPWLHSQRGRSATELEFRFGILGPHPRRAFCCFRSGDHHHENQTAQHQLQVLKEELRSHGRSGTLSVDDYDAARDLEEILLPRLFALIEDWFPWGQPEGPEVNEDANHLSYARVRGQGAVFPSHGLRGLVSALRETTRPLLVVGSAGAGKSTLAACLGSQVPLFRLPRRPQGLLARLAGVLRLRAEYECKIVTHFVAASTENRTWSGTLRRLVRLLGGDATDLDPETLRSTFFSLLENSEEPLVVVIDGLDLLGDAAGATGWLPERLPRHVRLVFTARPGSVTDSLSRATSRIFIEDLLHGSGPELCTTYLRAHGKLLSRTLSEKLEARLAGEGALFARLVAEELRLFGSHDELTAFALSLFESKDTPELLDGTMERLERDFGLELVSRLLGLLWVSQSGLTEWQLRNLATGPDTAPLPAAVWVSIKQRLEPLLFEQRGRFDFSVQGVADAVKQRYISSSSEDLLRRALAESASDDDWSGMSERLWQYATLEDWQRVEQSLHGEHLALGMARNPQRIVEYWRQIEQHTACRAVDAYAAGSFESSRWSTLAHSVALLLKELGQWDHAERIWEALLLDDGTTGSLRTNACIQLSSLKRVQGQRSAEIVLLEQACEMSTDDSQRAKLGGELATALVERGTASDLRRARQLYQTQENACRDRGDYFGAATARFNAARMYVGTGRERDALRTFEEYEGICTRIQFSRGVLSSIANQGAAKRALGRSKQARADGHRALLLARELREPRTSAEVLRLLAETAMDEEDYDAALDYLKDHDAVAPSREDLVLGLLSRCRLAHNTGGDAGTLLSTAIQLSKEAGLQSLALKASEMAPLFDV